MIRRGELWAIIPARGGSKGVLHKNIRLLAGVPLIAHTIMAAKESKIFSRCIVTTDDEDIAMVSRRYGAEVLRRPPELATDTSMSSDVIRHVLHVYNEKEGMPEDFILLQPTSPLRTADHIYRCWKEYHEGAYRSAVSVVEAEHHPYKELIVNKGAMRPLVSVETLEMPRQLLPKVYRQNGAIYIEKTESFLRESSFYIEPVLPFEMMQYESVDIDNEMDFYIAEYLLQKGINTSKKVKKIRGE